LLTRIFKRSIALLRQLYLDADWYAKGLSKTKDLSIEALNKNKGLVQIFGAESRVNALRADKIGDQFGIQYVILGGGDEYERIEAIKNTLKNGTYANFLITSGDIFDGKNKIYEHWIQGQKKI